MGPVPQTDRAYRDLVSIVGQVGVAVFIQNDAVFPVKNYKWRTGYPLVFSLDMTTDTVPVAPALPTWQMNKTNSDNFKVTGEVEVEP
ncbi:hypothetical protein SAMN02745129_2443 [Ferrimonas marina]|uniref:Uncharacterized protein n=1 Tax=Ferrimonas marina TaxID=299255 RepID=A0A1M5U7H8_9GAMM|nr:hypothetical protein SAMN02745129_2443 [Ferrimonas marina]